MNSHCLAPRPTSLLQAFVILTSLAGCAPGVTATSPTAAPEGGSTPTHDAAEGAEGVEGKATTNMEGTLLWVDAAEVDCSGVGPRTCLRVKESRAGEYRNFHAPIEGFDYVPGFEYVLRVRVSERANVPVDASSYRYELLEVVSESPSGLGLANTWVPPQRAAQGTVVVQFEEDRLVGSGGVNRFHATLQVNGTELSIGPMAVTRRAGPPAKMKAEQEFLGKLEKAASYRIVGDELRLFDGNRRVVLILRKANVSSEEGQAG